MKRFEDLKKLRTFCVYPFLHVNLSPSGHPLPCCNSLKYENERNEKPGDIIDFWQSSDMDQLRESLLNEQEHPDCRVCWKEESFCGNSLRTWTLEDTEKEKAWTKDDVEKSVFAFEQKKFQEVMPAYLQLAIGNKCNLKCRMCTPTSSSSLAQEAFSHRTEKTLPENLEDHRDELFSIDPWWESTTVFHKQLEHIHPSMKALRFTGGEPLLSRSFYDILEAMVQSGRAANCVLSINTNGTIVTSGAIELMKSFKEVDVKVSVDGYGDLLNYIRYPAKWKKVSANILRLNALTEFNVSVFVTVQALNVLYLDQLIQWCHVNSVNCSLSHLTNPAYYDISILPSNLEELAAEKLERVKAEVKGFLREDIEDVISHLRTTLESEDLLWDRFLRNTTLTDQIRGQNIVDFCPEFGPYFNSSLSDP